MKNMQKIREEIFYWEQSYNCITKTLTLLNIFNQNLFFNTPYIKSISIFVDIPNWIVIKVISQFKFYYVIFTI
jgi:hypothetical protein